MGFDMADLPIGVGAGGTGARNPFDARTNLEITDDLTFSGDVPTWPTALPITASTVQTQGQQVLSKSLNPVTVVANKNDVVTLPSAVKGMVLRIINSGAKTLRIFPAIGDAIGKKAVNASVRLRKNANVTFAAYDDTNWGAL